MKNTKLFYGLVLGVSYAISGSAGAAITNPVVVDFGFSPSRGVETVLTAGSYPGKANIAPNADGTCVGGACVLQNGMIVGTLRDDEVFNATGTDGGHLHSGGSLSNRQLAYHNDSAGIYIRALDSTAFSLDSIDINAPIDDDHNPYNDPALDYYEILGFSTALNPGLSLSNGTDWPTRVAFQTVLNGTEGTVVLNDAFRNVSAIWIHYAGVPNVANATFPFDVEIDNINVSAAQVAAVPLPAAVWMFGAGLMGLLSFGRKKA